MGMPTSMQLVAAGTNKSSGRGAVTVAEGQAGVGSRSSRGGGEAAVEGGGRAGIAWQGAWQSAVRAGVHMINIATLSRYPALPQQLK